jgi:hypothetical protein
LNQDELIEKLEWIKCCADDTHHMVDEIDNVINSIIEEGVR